MAPKMGHSIIGFRCLSLPHYLVDYSDLTTFELPFGLPSPEKEQETHFKLLGSVPPLSTFFDATFQHGSLLLLLYLQKVPQLQCNAMRMLWWRP